MNTLFVVAFVAVVATAHASLIGLGAGGVDSAAILAGPSGTVARTGIVGAPLGLGLGLGLGGVGIGGLGIGGLGLGLAVPAGSGLEGQWIPDINEKLYDDGSYKPHVYGL